MEELNERTDPAPGQEQNPTPQNAVPPRKEKKSRHRLIRCGWVRIPMKILLGLLIFILLIPVLIYLPPVQDVLKDVACRVASDATGMKISVGRFRLTFPLDVALDDVLIIDVAGDTMVRAGTAIADVKIKPLFDKDIRLNGLRLEKGYYRMVSTDSSMIMTIDAGLLDVDGKSAFRLAQMDLDLNKARLRDGSISLYMDVWKKKPTPPDSVKPSTPFKIKAGDLKLENISFAMSMLPTIDTMTVSSENIHLKDASIDLATNNIKARFLGLDKGSFTYLAPTPEYVRTHPAPIDTITPPSPPMTIEADSISLDGFDVLYGIAGARPQPGFDANYLSLTGVSASLHDFYNQQTTLRVPISRLLAKERCGLQLLSGSGLFLLDSIGIRLQDMNIRTPNTQLLATANIPFALMEMNPNAPMSVQARGNIGFPDIGYFMPALSQYTRMLAPARNMLLNLDAAGTLNSLKIARLETELPGVLFLRAQGKVIRPLKPAEMEGDVSFRAALTAPQVAQRLAGIKDVSIPSFDIGGTASVRGKNYAADFTMRSSAGDLAADGSVSLNSERYEASVNVSGLNVKDIMPSLGVGVVTATFDATGAGFNPVKPGAATDLRLDITRADYLGHSYRDIAGTVGLKNGVYNVDLTSHDPDAAFYVNGSGSVANDLYTADLTARVENLDLQALGFSNTLNNGSCDIYVQGTASPEQWLYDLNLDVQALDWNLPDKYIHLPAGVTASLLATADNVECHAVTDGASFDFTSPSGLKNVVDKLTAIAPVIDRQMKEKSLDVDVLQKALPEFAMHINSGGGGIVGQFLHPSGISMDTIYADISNMDSLITANIGTRRLVTQSVSLDTVTFNLKQRGSLLDYSAHIGNTPQTMPEFAMVDLNGYIGGNRLSAYLKQRNDKGEEGYRLGFTAALMDSTVTLHFTPLNATIAYLPWTFNLDNHVDYNFRTRHADAKLIASSARSSLLIETQDDPDGAESLHLNAKNLFVEDFLTLFMNAPDVKACLNADMNVRYEGRAFSGKGNVDVSQCQYNGQKIDPFSLGLNANLDMDGNTRASAALIVEEQQVMVLDGVIKANADAPDPNDFRLRLTRFPLQMANAFLGKDVAQLSGYVNGALQMDGQFSKPILNGVLSFEKAEAMIPMMGSSLKLSPDSIGVVNNVIDFNNFEIRGQNENPLQINGRVDMTDLSAISLNLRADANNFQLVNNDRRAKSDIYGKLFLNLGASVTGNLTRLDVNGNLTVLNTTDVFYTVSDAQATINQQQESQVVKFVNFNDTTQVQKSDSITPAMSIRIRAAATITPGTKVTVNLAPTGTNRVVLSPSGTLNYFQNYMGDMRLNGQLMLGEGYARYTLPVVGEKMFTFVSGSYIRWNGPLMNPILSIEAKDDMKVNVNDNGNARLVNFLVSLNVTNTLESPKVVFDLAAEGDTSIVNELQSMNPEQRSNQAMNLLLYGQYTGPNTSTVSGSNFAENALYGFLTSTLNNWAANNIRGVDLSFGVNQYDQTRDGRNQQATSYSYQVSKSLFNNRFKIVVGGNYSTDASADENFSENLLSDVSFEYMLKQTNSLSMLVKLFRHNDFESILEGEVSETGVGFVMKRRMENLRRFFRVRWGKKKSKPAQTDSLNVLPGDIPATLPADNGSSPDSLNSSDK